MYLRLYILHNPPVTLILTHRSYILIIFYYLNNFYIFFRKIKKFSQSLKSSRKNTIVVFVSPLEISTEISI